MVDDKIFISNRLKGTGYRGSEKDLWRVIIKEKSRDSDEPQEEFQYLANGVIVGLRHIKRDDGATVESTVVLRVYYNGDQSEDIEIPEKFLDAKLFTEYLPLGYRPAVGKNSKAYIIDSIRVQDPKMEQLTIYQHTGWRLVNKKPLFLHAAGAIGDEDVSVNLDGRLSKYKFSNEKHGDRWDVLRQFMKIAPPRVTFPLLAIASLSPLNEFFRKAGCEPSFLLFLLGRSGTKKSTLAALTLSFFGEFDNKSLPSSFKDTGNSLEKYGFLLKDVLTVVDDYHPAMNRTYTSRLEQTAQEVCRMYGDRTGRNRMNADGSLRVNYPPRGNALLTGEDIPSVGESGEARLMIVELLPEDVDMQMLTAVQGKSNRLNECMCDYIEWLAESYNDLATALKRRFFELRDKAQSGGHGRIAEAIAYMQVAIEVWTLFLKSREQVDNTQLEEIRNNSWEVFKELGEKQNRVMFDDKPSTLFITALKEMLATKRIRLIDINKQSTTFSGKDCIGWRDNNYAYLLGDTAYTEVCKFYRDQDKVFPVSKKQLLKHLAMDKYIVPGEQGNTHQKKIFGQNRRVVFLFENALSERAEEVNENA